MTGEGPVAQGFQLAFDKINELIECLESMQPAQSADCLTEQSVNGVTRRPKKKLQTTPDDSGGDARWS